VQDVADLLTDWIGGSSGSSGRAGSSRQAGRGGTEGMVLAKFVIKTVDKFLSSTDQAVHETHAVLPKDCHGGVMFLIRTSSRWCIHFGGGRGAFLISSQFILLPPALTTSLSTPHPFVVPATDVVKIRSQGVGFAQLLWAKMSDLKDLSVKMTHSGYLKLYQLSRPDLSRDYDIILLDEAQDSNPTVADVVLRQSCPKILVGDSHQAIYSFIGKVIQPL